MTDEEEMEREREADYVRRLAYKLVVSFARAGTHKAPSEAVLQAQQLWRAIRSAYPDTEP